LLQRGQFPGIGYGEKALQRIRAGMARRPATGRLQN